MNQLLAKLQNPRIFLAVLAALLVPLFVPIPLDWQQHPLLSPLADRAHVVLFGALTLLFYLWGPLKGRLLTVVVLCVALGGLTELLQMLADRSATLFDLYQDAQGAVLAGCWLWWRRTRRFMWPAVVAALVLAAIWWPLRELPTVVRESYAVLDQYPVLADFERPHSDILWAGHMDGEIERVVDNGGRHVLEVTSIDDARWPGASSRRLAWNWTGQDTLLVDVRAVKPSPETVQVTLWLEDRRPGRDIDYIARTFTVGHDWTTLSLPITEMRTRGQDRLLDLHNVQAVALFMNRIDGEPLAMQIDDMRLLPGGEHPGS